MNICNTIIVFIYKVLAIWGFLSLIGFVIYKVLHLDTWEQGLVKAFTATINFLYEGFTGKSSQDANINTALLCYDNEALEIVSRLNKHPYETPSLTSYVPNLNACSWYDISAVGLAPSYKDLDNVLISEMACKIIQNFFMETRNCQVNICIKVVSPTRLYFCIPLSEAGFRFIQKQNNTSPMGRIEENNENSLEEEFDFFSDEDKQGK